MATKRIDWESHIGRRLRLRDLHVFFTVVQCGSMAKAAAELGVSQPTVSEVIADVVPENSIRRDSRGEAESAHHPMRCLRSSTCLQRL
jgi:hypothetical protein